MNLGKYARHHSYIIPKDDCSIESVDLTLIKIAVRNSPSKDDFEKMVIEQYPHWLNNEEYSYLQIGGELGDQHLALLVIGLGHLLGLWQALSPDIVTPDLSQEIKYQMAGMGLVTLKKNLAIETS